MHAAKDILHPAITDIPDSYTKNFEFRIGFMKRWKPCKTLSQAAPQVQKDSETDQLLPQTSIPKPPPSQEPTLKQVLADLVNTLKDVQAKQSFAKKVRQWVDGIDIFRKIVGSLLILGLLIILVGIIIAEAKDVVLIESFDTPSELQKNGYTSHVIAGKLADQINEITVRSNTKITHPNFTSAAYEVLPDVEVSGVRAPLGSIASYIKRFLGRTTIHITGELIMQGDHLRLTARIIKSNGEAGGNSSQSFEKKLDELESKLLPEAAEFILEKIEPYILAAYYYEESQNSKPPKDQQSLTELSLKVTKACIDSGSLVQHDTCEYREWAYVLWGLNLVTQKNYDDAIAKYQEAIKLAPNDFIAHHNVGYAWQQLYEKDKQQPEYDHALAEYEKAIEINRNFPLSYVRMGILMQVHGKQNPNEAATSYEKAFSYYKKAIDLNPKDHLAYNNWGYALQEWADTLRNSQEKDEAKINNLEDEAEAKYLEALNLNPQYALAYDNLGYLYGQQKKYKKAQVQFQKAVQVNKYFSDAYKDWCMMLQEWGKNPYNKNRFTVARTNFLKQVEETERLKSGEILSGAKECIDELRKKPKRNRP
jgi:tetratricopeptide (TPR) repeat protein